MSSFAPALRSQTTDAKAVHLRHLGKDVLQRRKRRRRQILLMQLGSYLVLAAIMSIYSRTGVISATLPLLFALCGTFVTSGFLVMSQIEFSDRFKDHYLALPQVAANVAIQAGFLIAAPAIGYLFLGTLFVIFSFGTLRMSSRQAVIAWSLMTVCVAPIFVTTSAPISMPSSNYLERVAAMLCFVATIGQCAFVGLLSSTLRNQLYKNSRALEIAYKRIEELAELDELTGAFNRRSIMRSLNEEITRATQLNHRCSVALIDIDWFKRINDTFGHPAGDEVLRTFAISMFANIRTIDAFGRYGGEEFLLVLPETATDEAGRILNRLRLIVSELDWSALSPHLTLTMSAGVATLLPDDNAESVLARADAALYRAKRQGRNRIENFA